MTTPTDAGNDIGVKFDMSHIDTTIATIQEIVAHQAGVPVAIMKDQTRQAYVAWARQVCMWACYQTLRNDPGAASFGAAFRSASALAKVIGDRFNRDRGTVIHAVKCVDDRRSIDAKVTVETDKLLQSVHAALSEQQAA